MKLEQMWRHLLTENEKSLITFPTIQLWFSDISKFLCKNIRNLIFKISMQHLHCSHYKLTPKCHSYELQSQDQNSISVFLCDIKHIFSVAIFRWTMQAKFEGTLELRTLWVYSEKKNQFLCSHRVNYFQWECHKCIDHKVCC